MAFMNFMGKAKAKGTGTNPHKLLRIITRFLQFVLAVTVAGIYGVDLGRASSHGVHMDTKWVYAVVVAGISAITVIVYGILVCISKDIFFAWDWIVFLLWTVLFGIFGRIYIPANPTPEQKDQIRMKNAVWIDLINMIFWLLTATYGTWMFFHHRGKRVPGKGQA